MAEFLVKAIDYVDRNPIKDGKYSYKRGDIVEVYADGRCTVAPAPGSKFYIIKFPGLTGVKDHMYPLYNVSTGLIQRRRKWFFDINALTSIEKTALTSGRWLTLNKSRHDDLCKAKAS